MDGLKEKEKKYGPINLLVFIILVFLSVTVFLFLLSVSAFLTRGMSDDRIVERDLKNKEASYLYGKEITPEVKLNSKKMFKKETEENIQLAPIIRSPQKYIVTEMDFHQAIDPLLNDIKECCLEYEHESEEHTFEFNYEAEISRRMDFGSLLSFTAQKNKIPFVLMRCIRKKMKQYKLVNLKENELSQKIETHFVWKNGVLTVDYITN